MPDYRHGTHPLQLTGFLCRSAAKTPNHFAFISCKIYIVAQESSVYYSIVLQPVFPSLSMICRDTPIWYGTCEYAHGFPNCLRSGQERIATFA